MEEEAKVDPTEGMTSEERLHWSILHRHKEGIEDAIADIRRGKMVIVIDDEAAPDWTDDDRRVFQEGLSELGFESAFDQEGIEVFARG